jgi:hypothetical protein
VLVLLTLALLVPPSAAKPAPAPPPPPPPAAAAAPAPPAEQVDPGMEADIRMLIEVSGGAALGKQMFDGMMGSFRGTMPGVPAAFWDGMAREFDPNEFTNLLVPIYARYYTREDIQALVAFYRSPLGQKMVSVNPMVVQDSMAAGQTWGRQIAERVIAKLQESGQAPPQ